MIALILSEFDYTIEYQAGLKMLHVDSLSRHPVCMTVVYSEFLIRVQQAQQVYPEINALITLVETTEHENFKTWYTI